MADNRCGAAAHAERSGELDWDDGVLTKGKPSDERCSACARLDRQLADQVVDSELQALALQLGVTREELGAVAHLGVGALRVLGKIAGKNTGAR